MIDRSRAVFTQHNNVIGTVNVLFAIKVRLRALLQEEMALVGVLGVAGLEQGCLITPLSHVSHLATLCECLMSSCRLLTLSTSVLLILDIHAILLLCTLH